MRITSAQTIELIVLTIASFAVSFFGLNYCSVAKALFTTEGIRILPYSLAAVTFIIQLLLQKNLTLKQLTH